MRVLRPLRVGQCPGDVRHRRALARRGVAGGAHDDAARRCRVRCCERCPQRRGRGPPVDGPWVERTGLGRTEGPARGHPRSSTAAGTTSSSASGPATTPARRPTPSSAGPVLPGRGSLPPGPIHRRAKRRRWPRAKPGALADRPAVRNLELRCPPLAVNVALIDDADTAAAASIEPIADEVFSTDASRPYLRGAVKNERWTTLTCAPPTALDSIPPRWASPGSRRVGGRHTSPTAHCLRTCTLPPGPREPVDDRRIPNPRHPPTCARAAAL